MAQLPNYVLSITATLSGVAINNARVIVRNERTDETINANTNSSGEVLLDAANLTSGVSTGDSLTIFTAYTNSEGSTTHTVTSGGADITLTLTTVPASDELRYFTVQDYYDFVGYESTDSDIIKSVDIVNVGVSIEDEIDNQLDMKFDSSNTVIDEYHDCRNTWDRDFFLKYKPIQAVKGFWINDSSDGVSRNWRNLAYTLLDDMSATTNWTGASGGSDTITLSVNTTPSEVNNGTACINVAKSGTNNATITVSRSNITSTDITDKEVRFDVYTDSIDDLTATDAVEIRIGSSSSAYYSQTFDNSNFSNEAWTTLTMETSDTGVTTTGTPDITACTYFAIVTTLAAVSTTLTAGDIRLDYLRLEEDFYLDISDETARVRILDSSDYPVRGSKQVKATYTYGHTTVPADIKRLAILMTQRHFMLSAMAKATASGREFTPNMTFLDREIKMIRGEYEVWNIRNT